MSFSECLFVRGENFLYNFILWIEKCFCFIKYNLVNENNKLVYCVILFFLMLKKKVSWLEWVFVGINKV